MRFGGNKLLDIARKPVEAVTFIIAFSLLAFSLYLVSPWYEPGYDRVIADSPTNRYVEYVVGVAFFLISLPGAIFPFLNDGARQNALKFATFSMFIAFLFQAILRIVSVGWTPVHWLSVLVISLICGALRLYLEVKRD